MEYNSNFVLNLILTSNSTQESQKSGFSFLWVSIIKNQFFKFRPSFKSASICLQVSILDASVVNC